MNFGEAIEAMEQGKEVTTPRWRKEGSSVVSARLMPASGEHEPFIAWMLPDGTWEPMVYSHKNVLAKDWEILDN